MKARSRLSTGVQRAPAWCLALLVPLGCGDGPAAPDEPTTGAVSVETTTVGTSLDPDGYTLSIDGAPGPTIDLDDTVSIAELAPGDHELELEGVSPNCGVSADNPRPFTVVAGQTTSISFGVSCFDPTGTIDVTLATTGATPDPNGYELFVDGALRRLVAANGSVSVAHLAPGDHVLELRDLESNCVATDENPRTVPVAPYETTSVTFGIECAFIPRVIAFVTDRRGNPAGPEIFLVDAEGSSPVNLRADRALDTDPAWSPGGSRLAFTRDGGWFNPDVFITNVAGTLLDRLTDTGIDGSPSWSPDGTRLAVSDDDAVFLIHADRSGRVLLADGPGFDGQPAWSPDGERIAFVSEREGRRAIFVVDVHGSGIVRLSGSAGPDTDPAWSPDGERIAFRSERDGNPEIYVMADDGSDPVRLTNDPGFDGQPVWSPDGLRIAFSTERDGNFEIYVMNADGSDPVNLTNHPADDREPAWAW